MSVVSGGKTIFCEGKQTSLDYELLSRVVEGIPGDKCTIVPAGGKFTFSIFAQGYFFPDEVGNQRYIVFRDRDFDARPTSSIQLLQLGNKLGNRSIVLTYRACVENYLLETDLIHTYWAAKHIQKEMQKQKPNYISLSSFFEWAITQLDITQYPDLMDLRTRIEQL